MAEPLFSAQGLSGRRALVTGGAKGIGAAVVRVMSAAGAHVAFMDRNQDEGTALAAETGGQFLQGDLMDFAWIERAAAEQGPFDVLINNVGVDQHAFFTATEEADWDFLLGINLKSVFATTKAVLPMMQTAKFGRVINIASEAARRGSKGGSIYSAAKGGLVSFTKSLALENARFGITANVICPGPVETPLLNRAVEDHGGEKLKAAMENATLLGRLGTPEEVANTVTFFASDQAGFITGEVLGVSGGMGV